MSCSRLFLFCLLFFFPYLPLTGAELTAKSLARAMNGADDPRSNQSVIALALDHPHLCREILFFPDGEESNNKARWLAFLAFKSASQTGKVSFERFWDVSIKFFDHLNTLGNNSSMAKSYFTSSLSNFSYVPIQNLQIYKFPENIRVLSLIVTAMKENKWILNQRGFETIEAILSEILQANSTKPSIDFLRGKLGQIIEHTRALWANKLITEDAHNILVGYCINTLKQFQAPSF
jgi:hypothetical protein